MVLQEYDEYTMEQTFEVLEKTKRKLIVNIKKRQFKFLGYLMKKECLENLTLTEQSEVKRIRLKQLLKYLVSLIE